jgi:hypothetical protein
MSESREGGITDEDIRKTLKSSGYPLEQEMASILEKMGWDFTLNYAFTDIETDISREIDILAERSLWYEKPPETLVKELTQNEFSTKNKSEWKTVEQRVRLNVEIIIECKKIGAPIVFFCRQKQPKDFLPTRSDDIIQHSGVKPEIKIKPLNELSIHIFSLGQFLKFGKISHYSKCQEKATQFCKVFRAGKDLKAEHGDIYQSFIVPLIKAVEYQKIVRKLKPTWRYFDMYLHYPMLIIDGEMLRANAECTSVESTNHVELMRNYYSNKIGGTYRIDIIKKDYFNEFIEKVLMPSLLTIAVEVGKKQNDIANGKVFTRKIEKFFDFHST